MENQFYILCIVSLLCIPLHSMEKAPSHLIAPTRVIMPIRDYQYNKHSITNMKNSVELYVSVATEFNITSGIITSMNKIKNEGIEQLIKNEDALYVANQMLQKIKTDHVFNNLESMNASLLLYRQLLGEDVKNIIDDTSRPYINLIGFTLLKSMCNVKLPTKGLFDLLMYTGKASVHRTKEFLMLNVDFDSEKNSKYVKGMVLLSEYLFERQRKEADSTIDKDED